MIDSIEKITNIILRKHNGSAGLWIGNPHHDTEIIYKKKLGVSDLNSLHNLFCDSVRLVEADWAYADPDGNIGNPFFQYELAAHKKHDEGVMGYLDNINSISELDKFNWPNPDYIDYKAQAAIVKEANLNGCSVFGGIWSPFFHNIADLFGMEEYFVKMYTEPKMVDAVTDRVMEFYLECMERFFKALDKTPMIFFFGNDFGTQRDLFLSPEMFERFILPSFKKIVTLAKKHGYPVLLHSCGSIYRVIPKLIDAGIDAIHPLQALAANMDAKRLAKEFKNDLAFAGGVDTQDLLVNGTPMQVREEVLRLRDLLEPNYIVSPSHEALLPNVPIENVFAMAMATRE
jgi:uroporphyrinogen decarboxylase